MKLINYLKKHLLFIVLFCIILFALLFILLFNKSNNDIISNNDNITNNANNSMFAIMLETEARSGTYKKSTSGTWPREGYIFNENLSVCENGSELTWNEELGAVNLKTNIADRCFVYFDVYIPNIFYKYNASLNDDYINNGRLLSDIESTTDDEILLMFDEYQGEFNANNHLLFKSGNVSNREYSLNYGLNSIIYFNNSNVYLTNPTIESYSNYSPIFYLKNSNLDVGDVYINNYQETNDILAILNNSNFDVSDTSITSLNDLYVYINGTSNAFSVNNLFYYEVNGEEKPLSFILNDSSDLTLTNNVSNGSFNSNVTLNKSSNIVITNMGNMTMNLNSDVASTALIYNNTNMDGCFNPNNNSDFNINLQNNGTLNLTCNSYISTFENYMEIDYINSNGFSIYYDSSKSTTISGIVDLNGGGQLIPY